MGSSRAPSALSAFSVGRQPAVQPVGQGGDDKHQNGEETEPHRIGFEDGVESWHSKTAPMGPAAARAMVRALGSWRRALFMEMLVDFAGKGF
jgi:hypothetical protein